MNQMVKNPFQQTAVSEALPNAMTEVKAQREASEIQAMVFMAKQFPRNQIQAADRILNACTRQTLADSAVYSYPRGGQNVEGPSIRLAEVLAQNWGNLDFGIRELSQENGVSTVEAYAWDLETNVRQAKVFQVAHKRMAKGGTKTLTDPRDIYEMVANQGSRRLRACILSIIPGDIVEAALAQCSVTQAASVGATPEEIKETIRKLTATMEKFGITAENIQDRYQCRLEAIRPAQIVELRKIYTSLKDGMSKPSDWFVIQEVKKSSAQDLNAMVEAQPVEKANPEPVEEAPQPTPTEEQFAALVEAVSTGVKEVAEVLKTYNLTDEQKAEINAL
ncbi:hypothetical protein [Neisseria sicca]|uniref:hypothetical protein n=1 Tax=Neisseria sicca TaxID=490 RepID=UPI003F9F1F62